MAAIPALEAISVYYKMVANIDCYPLVIDFTRISCDEDFCETVDAVLLAFSAVEFFNVSQERVDAFKAFLQKRNRTKQYAYINGGVKMEMDARFNIAESPMKKMSKKVLQEPIPTFSANGVYAAVLRTALDM